MDSFGFQMQRKAEILMPLSAALCFKSYGIEFLLDPHAQFHYLESFEDMEDH